MLASNRGCGCRFARSLRLLFREGSEINGKLLRGFSVLQSVPLQRGIHRAFNNYSELVWLGRFSGGQQAIVRKSFRSSPLSD
jgi:hypothetical protein